MNEYQCPNCKIEYSFSDSLTHCLICQSPLTHSTKSLVVSCGHDHTPITRIRNGITYNLCEDCKNLFDKHQLEFAS